jgi:hypothetical protein
MYLSVRFFPFFLFPFFFLLLLSLVFDLDAPLFSFSYSSLSELLGDLLNGAYSTPVLHCRLNVFVVDVEGLRWRQRLMIDILVLKVYA